MLQKSLQVISVVLLPLILLLLSLDLVAFNDNYYPKAFTKYNIYENIDTPRESVDHQAQNILNYIQSEEGLEGNLLDDKEKRHLADVKNLVTRGQQILIIALLIWIACFIVAEHKKKILFYGSLLTIILIILLSLINFQALFLQFHLLAFDNDLWLLNPATDNLIKMYPQELFQDIVRKGMFHTVVGAVLLMGMCGKRKKNKKVLEVS